MAEETLGEKQRLVLHAIRRHGPLTRADAARLTGLSRSSVHAFTAELLDAELICAEEQRPARGRGRPAATFTYAGGGGHVLALAFEQDRFSVAVADLNGQIQHEHSRSFDAAHDPEGALHSAAEMAAQLLAEAGSTPGAALRAVASLAGPVDARRGTIGSPSILPGWSSADPARRLSDILGVPTTIENDANLGAFAEAHHGAAPGCQDLIYVKASTGVGAGLLLGGRIYRGAAGLAGELGHVTIDSAGRICRCGSKGCLETIAGAAGIIAALHGTHGPDLTIAQLIELAGSGDAAAARALADAGTALGRAIGEISNVLNPQQVILGGQLAAAGDLVLEPLRTSLRQAAMQVIAGHLEVRGAALGARAELVGAAALAAALVHDDEPAIVPVAG